MALALACASCNVVSGWAWALLMDAEALSVCGEELGELRHYGAGLRGTAALPTADWLHAAPFVRPIMQTFKHVSAPPHVAFRPESGLVPPTITAAYGQHKLLARLPPCLLRG